VNGYVPCVSRDCFIDPGLENYDIKGDFRHSCEFGVDVDRVL
jgi:hypothetical protein